MKQYLTGALTVYLSAALLYAFAIINVIPATNVIGATYYGLLWPFWPMEQIAHTKFIPIPDWCFTFDGQ